MVLIQLLRSEVTFLWFFHCLQANLEVFSVSSNLRQFEKSVIDFSALIFAQFSAPAGRRI